MIRVTVRQVDLLLRSTQWIVGVAAVWVLVTTMFWRVPLPVPDLAAASEPVDVVESPEMTNRDLDHFAAIWERNLRQTLIEPKPQPKPKSKPTPPPKPPRLPKLLATFVEGGNGWGLFIDENGARRVRPAGGKIDAFYIETIETGYARLRGGSHTYEVRLPERQNSIGLRQGRH